MKLALSMIVSGSESYEDVKRCLDSITEYVDGVFITVTSEDKQELVSKLKQTGATVDYEPTKFWMKASKSSVKWLKQFLTQEPMLKPEDKQFDFGAARNHAMAQIPQDYGWMVWLDADDVFRGGSGLRDLIARAEAQGVESIFLNYIYQAEIVDGKVKNVMIEHLRERLVRLDGSYEWVAPIHETLIEKHPTKKVDFKDCDVLHLSTHERREEALVRNAKTLELSIYNTKGADPRPIYYLGKSYFDFFLTSNDKACLNRSIALFEKYLYGTREHQNKNKSGWAEERAQCWEYLTEIYRHLNQVTNAIKCAHNALIEDERFPSIYINLSMCYLIKGEYKRAMHWVKLAGKIPQPLTTLVINPKDLASRAMEVVYHSGIHLSKLDEAWAAATKLLELYPDSPDMRERVKFTTNLRTQRELTRDIVKLYNFLVKSGEHTKARLLMAATPNLIADNPIITDIKNYIDPPKTWADDEVVIFCGPGFTTWSPKSLNRTNEAEFVGGSEEAVIYLSQALTKQGYRVTVYAEPGAEEGLHNGVMYLPHYKFNPKDTFHILVSWRAIGFFDQKLEAKKKYVWCHDVLNQLDHTSERLDKLNKVIVLSQAHRETIPQVPDDKILVSSNGFYEHTDSPSTNHPHEIIWTSSYDRGLQHLLDIWPDVIKAVPDAKLHVFYGWKLFKQFYADNPERMEWLKEIEVKLKQPGITHHGRVSQTELESWIKGCGIWAYPTDFYEINCISAIKAQAFGAIPVCMNYAALKETVQYGVKIEGDIYDKETKDNYKEALIKTLQSDQKRDEMMAWAREKYSWDAIAKQWSKEFGANELKEAADTLIQANPKSETLLPTQLQEKYGLTASY